MPRPVSNTFLSRGKETAVLVGVVGQHAVNPHPRHFEKRVIDVAAVASINECFGKLPGQADLLVELAVRQQPRIAGNLSIRWLYHDRLGCEKIEGQLKSTLLIRLVPP